MADRLEAHETTRRNLTADVAHELRTPLTLLQGNCEEIIDGIAEPSLDRFVQMHDDVLRLRRLVDDLGALADADAATTRLGIDHHTCDLAVEVGTVLDGLAPTIEANQQHLQHHLEHVHVDGDAARLGQIVTNLVTNAIKYTPHGGHIIVTVGPGPDDTAVLSVSDDGPGIAAADQPHVFERFYRAETARTAAGSGIGLAVVAQLVAAHHGTVVLVPTAVGTTIEVTFPRVPQSTASKALDQEPSRSRRLGVDG
jgi:signal transduction histidine kinase